MIRLPHTYYKYLGILILFVIGGIIYSNTINSPFVFDDNVWITNNSNIIQFENYIHHPLKYFIRARSIANFSFSINYYFGKLNPKNYHITNIIIHILNTTLIWIFVVLTLQTPKLKNKYKQNERYLLGFLVSLIFISHPIQTQAVTYIIQRLASLATTFYLLTMITISYLLINKNLQLTKKIFLILLSSIFLIIGLFTKEITVTIPISIILYYLIFFKFRPNKFNLIYGGGIIATIIIIISKIILRSYSLKFIFANKISNTNELITPYTYFFTQLRVIPKYIQLLFIPINQNLDYYFPLSTSWRNISVIGGFLLIILTIIIAIKQIKIRPLLSFGILFFFISLSITSSIFPIEDVIFEHRLYLPMIGFSLVLIDIIWELSKKSITNTAKIIILITILFSILTYQRNATWATKESIYLDIIQKSPKVKRNYNNLGSYYYETNQLNKAETYYQKSLEIDPQYTIAYISLGEIALKKSNYQQAIKLFNTALKIATKDKDIAIIYNNIGITYLKKKDYLTAIEYLTKAKTQTQNNPIDNREKIVSSINTNLSEAYYQMALDLIDHKLEQEAISIFEKSISYNPKNPIIYANYAVIMAMQGKYDQAQKLFEKALEIDPNYQFAKDNLVKLQQIK